MTYEEARNLIKSRSGPREDDWDLFEAAAIMLQNNDDLCKSALDGMKYSGLINDYHVALSRIAALEAEVGRLREALEKQDICSGEKEDPLNSILEEDSISSRNLEAMRSLPKEQP